MPSIEEEARTLRCRALVVARLCDASAQAARHEGWDDRERDAYFWHGVEGLMLDIVSFFERLPRVVPGHILNHQMPPEGSPFYDTPTELDDATGTGESAIGKEGER
jgi:hypothetical protein